MARPKSEDKKLAILEAATIAIGQAGIVASTAQIARAAGVAEGTLFRYFATKDDLLNELYLHLKQGLLFSMQENLDRTLKDPKEYTRYIWNSYIDWAIRNSQAHRAIRQLAVSDKIGEETKQKVAEMFPEMHEICSQSILKAFQNGPYRAFSDAMFSSLAETTMEFASREPERAGDYKALGFESMWRALAQ
ncbi:TetR/AcrR family transcriptional regulator [Buttiauxella gaviniae]|uniref:TetR/AcrR family transcriptional regulator n=1 Tax=Buttiauxella gaviniae TaxID=82990 RepID=UPI0039AFD013